MRALLIRLIVDETGGETFEYAVVIGLVVIAAISVVKGIGVKVLAKWTSLNASM